MMPFTMHRTGTFTAVGLAENQCRDVTTARFDYSCTLKWAPHTPLNPQGFLIDHAAIDLAVQAAPLAGSCEQMHGTMWHAIAITLAEAGLWRHVLHYSATIRGHACASLAWLEWEMDASEIARVGPTIERAAAVRARVRRAIMGEAAAPITVS